MSSENIHLFTLCYINVNKDNKICYIVVNCLFLQDQMMIVTVNCIIY